MVVLEIEMSGSRKFRIKTEHDGREYLVLRNTFDVRENAEAKAAELTLTNGGRYWVTEA
jgi:hypothetical protein